MARAYIQIATIYPQALRRELLAYQGVIVLLGIHSRSIGPGAGSAEVKFLAKPPEISEVILAWAGPSVRTVLSGETVNPSEPTTEYQRCPTASVLLTILHRNLHCHESARYPPPCSMHE
jgi:hypothetical protein